MSLIVEHKCGRLSMCKDNIDEMRYAYNSIKNKDKKRTTADKPCQIYTASPVELKAIGSDSPLHPLPPLLCYGLRSIAEYTCCSIYVF